MTPAASLLRAAFRAGVDAVSAQACLPPHLPTSRGRGRTVVLGIGKAAGAMAQVAASRLHVDAGLVVVPDEHHPTIPLPAQFDLLTASHPVPDRRGLDAAERALRLVRSLSAGDRLIALISGGGSALLPLPVGGVSLDDKRALTRALLGCGATITEINTVRQCLSRIKGGRLAAAAGQGVEVLTLAISDIPCDDVSLVSSGPTLPSRASLAEARAVIERFGLAVPAGVARALDDPANEPPRIRAGEAKLVGRSADALAAISCHLRSNGYRPIVVGDDLEGEACELAETDAAMALSFATNDEHVALIAGGEGTVSLPADAPRGGRNAEYSLALAIALRGHPRVCALACDSDGIDGSSPAAGAIVRPDTLERMRLSGFDPQATLLAHNAYAAFDRLGETVVTGPTLTNVNDIRILLIS